MTLTNETDGKPKSRRERFGEQALEHKVFSGIAGTLLIVVVTVVIAVGANSGDSPDPGTTASTEPATTATTEEDAPVEESAGQVSEEQPPEASGEIGLVRWAEHEGHEVLLTENVYREQVTVDAITDPDGLQAELSESQHSGGITVFGNGRLQTIKGRVGVATEPCSAGSIAYVSVRGPEGEQLWPEGGRPKAVHRESVPFEATIADLDSAVLYAEAPVAEEGYCGSFFDETHVGWVHLTVTR